MLSTFGYKFQNDFSSGVPSDGGFTVPSRCTTQEDYSPGTLTPYWDFTSWAEGYASVTMYLQPALEADVVTIRQAYSAAKANIDYSSPSTSTGTRARTWAYRFDGESGTWKSLSGIMEQPAQQGFSAGGGLSNDFKVTLGRLNFHLNAHDTDKDAYEDARLFNTYQLGDQEYQNNDYRL